jgi:putative tricarboxylic transport membrane protein
METKLRSAMARVKVPIDFFDRPIAAILGLAIICLIIGHFVGLYRERQNREPDSDHDMHDTFER